MEGGELGDMEGIEIEERERKRIRRIQALERRSGSISADLMWMVGCGGWHIGGGYRGGGWAGRIVGSLWRHQVTGST